ADRLLALAVDDQLVAGQQRGRVLRAGELHRRVVGVVAVVEEPRPLVLELLRPDLVAGEPERLDAVAGPAGRHGAEGEDFLAAGEEGGAVDPLLADLVGADDLAGLVEAEDVGVAEGGDGADDDLLAVVGDVEAGDAHAWQGPDAARVPAGRAGRPGRRGGGQRARDADEEAEGEGASHVPFRSWRRVPDDPRRTSYRRPGAAATAPGAGRCRGCPWPGGLQKIPATYAPSQFVFRLGHGQSAGDDLPHFAGQIDSIPDETEREEVRRARVGQGRFRRSLLELWGARCAVTGVELPAVLTASHVKPWRCATNAERLDPHNGLLLLPQYDRLFDRGFVSFADDGGILVSPSLAPYELELLGVREGAKF